MVANCSAGAGIPELGVGLSFLSKNDGTEETFAKTTEVNCRQGLSIYQMTSLLKPTSALKIAMGAFALLVIWIGFQLATHGHTGILRILVISKHFLSQSSITPVVRQASTSAPAGTSHSVNLSWKPSTSAIVGYNVYRRGAWGVVRINSELVTGSSYVDRTVLAGQTYFYVIKAVNAKGTESAASNEIRADIPSK